MTAKDPTVQELIEKMKDLGGGYRPPKRQGVYWDTVDALERSAEMEKALLDARKWIVEGKGHATYVEWVQRRIAVLSTIDSALPTDRADERKEL